MTTLVLATGNPGKVREFSTLLADLDWQVVPQSQFNVPEAEETGLSFVENAILKARNAAAHTGLPALADDSGIEVDALQGAPGIYSARYAGVGAGDAANTDKLLAALAGLAPEQRRARYQCVLVFMRHAHDPTPLICQGSWEGVVSVQPQGQQGFGYDPVFYLPELNCTAAELEPAVKNRLSHRAQALAQLHSQLSLQRGQ